MSSKNPPPTGLQRLAAFARSPHHLWLAVLALGGGLATAHPIGMIAGAAAYLLGWVYLPDTRRFRKWLEKRAAGQPDEEEAGARRRAEALRRSRERLFANLTAGRRDQYRRLAAVAEEIEAHIRQLPEESRLLSADLQLQPLDSLMASYLRLLHTEQVLEAFVDREAAENLDGEADALGSEVADLESRAAGAPSDLSLEQLLESRRRRLDAVRKRRDRLAEARGKLILTRAEQERTVDLVKLALADLITSRDPAVLRHRIDAGARQMAEQHEWVDAWDRDADVDPAFDLVPGARIGFSLEGTRGGSDGPPPIPQSS